MGYANNAYPWSDELKMVVRLSDKPNKEIIEMAKK